MIKRSSEEKVKKGQTDLILCETFEMLHSLLGRLRIRGFNVKYRLWITCKVKIISSRSNFLQTGKVDLCIKYISRLMTLNDKYSIHSMTSFYMWIASQIKLNSYFYN